VVVIVLHFNREIFLLILSCAVHLFFSAPRSKKFLECALVFSLTGAPLAWLIPLGSLIAPSVVSFSLQRFTSLLRPVSVTLATAGWCLLFVCESPSVAAVQISSLVILVAK
jgi:hypothetical protein